MKHLTQQFTVHPVGQGLFYSGRIDIKEDSQQTAAPPFNFAFDCGSLNDANADEEVALYRDKYLPNGTDLDLLVISHFDADHVSHIKKLLDKRKVKKVVLPFSMLEERLYLVLDHYNRLEGDNIPGDDFFIRFILDPIGTLGPYLSDGGSIYIVTSGPNRPFPDPENDNINESDSSVNVDNNGLTFDVKVTNIDATVADQFFITDIAGSNVKMFSDVEKCFLKFGYRTRLMEFLFYRRDIGRDNNEFFEAAYKAFCAKYGLKEQDKSQTAIDALMEKVKNIDNAGPIRELYRKVKAAHLQFKVSGKVISDLNTTALCLLHYTLQTSYTWSRPDCYDIDTDVVIIKKFDGTNNTRVEDREQHFYPHRYHWHTHHPPARFPNCMLTSDSFLKTEEEVSGLYNKYQNYWVRFWLFQVPHHGAASSTGLELLNRLPLRLVKFINYGTTHQFVKRWRHPSPQLINDLIASGQSTNVLPINEFTGLAFGIDYPY